MKQYTHNYALPSKAESLLYSATRLMANDCYDAALERINEARQLLQQYLSQDNMVEDDNVENGWVHYNDAQAEIDRLHNLNRHYLETLHAQGRVALEIVRCSEEQIREKKYRS